MGCSGLAYDPRDSLCISASMLLNIYLMITPVADPAVMFSGETVDLFSTAAAFTLNLMNYGHCIYE